jgi:hypothetical protein
MSTKKITVNPDLFNTGGSTSKNRGEKKAKPVIPIQINENSLKDQEKNEIILYEVNILQKQKKFDELVSLLETQKKY